MSSDTSLDDTLIDLFRSEVETHTEVLSAALLALERAPRDTSRIDEMMRAAHSIKGAARVVGVDPAVSVAHVMEDCFVEAQKGAISFSPGDVDILLSGVDLLSRISAATRDPNVDLATEFSGAVQAQVVELQAVLSGTAGSAAEAMTVAEPDATAAPEVEAAPCEPSSGSILSPAETIAFPEFLDSVAAEQIRRQLVRAIDSGCVTIQFDLRTTRDLDVQGLAFLAAVPRHLAQRGGSSLKMAGVSDEMATVLRVTGLDKSFEIHPGATQKAE